MNYQILLIVIVFNYLTGMSQTSLKGELLTLSNDVYLESHDVDSVVIIGSALFNVKTNKVIGFTFSSNDGYGGLEEELMGRWLSPDVYESRLAYSSPYSFAVNKPIIATDPNGKFVRFLNESGKEAFTENLKNLTSSDIKLQQELLGALETTKAKMTIEKRDPDTDTWHAEPTIEGIEVTFIGKNVHALTKKVANSNLSDEAKTKLLVQLSYLTSSDALVEIEGVDPQTQVNYSTNKTDGKENTPSTLSSSRYSITSKSRANGKPLNDAEVNELTNNGAGAGHPNGDAHRQQNIRTTFEVLEGSQWIKKVADGIVVVDISNPDGINNASKEDGFRGYNFKKATPKKYVGQDKKYKNYIKTTYKIENGKIQAPDKKSTQVKKTR